MGAGQRGEFTFSVRRTWQLSRLRTGKNGVIKRRIGFIISIPTILTKPCDPPSMGPDKTDP